jgi:hypothetical protein
MELYTIIVSTDISGRVLPENRPAQPESPVFEISFHKKDGRIDVLEYFPGGKGEMLLSVNNEINFSTYTRTILDIRRNLNNLLNN